jgi:predicted metalloprotease with PDZ domain
VGCKKGLAYVRAKKTVATPPDHNRLGAVFVPIESQSDDLIAHVIAGGPAYDAGVRDGDVLLKIDKLDVTRWRTDPTILVVWESWVERNVPLATGIAALIH